MVAFTIPYYLACAMLRKSMETPQPEWTSLLFCSTPPPLKTPKVKEMVPDMDLAQRSWMAQSKEDPALAAKILETVKERNMAPWYASLSHQHPSLFPLDAKLLATMKEANEAEEAKIAEVIGCRWWWWRGWGDGTHYPSRCLETTDTRIPTMPRRSTSGFHRQRGRVLQ